MTYPRPWLASLLLAAGLLPATSCRSNDRGPALQPDEIRVGCDRPAGRIKADLAGVSQGGNADGYLKPQVLAALQELPIKMVRLEAVTCNNTYTLYDPATGRYDWTKLDQEIEAIQKSGATVMLNIFGMPQWLSKDPEQKLGAWWWAPPRDEQRWARYVGDIVRHVNHDKHYNIKYWEFWNEPSGGYFFTHWKLGKELCWRLYEVTARAVKEADPTALVGGFGDNVHYPEHYRDWFEYCRPRQIPIDFLTVHWYGEWPEADSWKKPELYQRYAVALNALHASYYPREVPIFYTEWNLPAESDSAFSAIQQAAFMGSAFYWLQESPAAGAMFFRVEKYRALGALLDEQFRPQAPWRIMKLFTQLPAQRVQVQGVGNGITVLAAREPGRLAVLLSRYDTAPGARAVEKTLTLYGHGFTGSCRLTIRRETAASAASPGPWPPAAPTVLAVTAGQPISVPLPLEPYAVAWVEIAGDE